MTGDTPDVGAAQRPLAERRTLTVPLGVVVARDAITHPWADHVWRVVSVFLDAPPLTDGWREMLRTETSVHYHIANLELDLHRKETPGYRANLETGAPVVYVILRTGAAEGGSEPIHASLVTASAHDVEAYGHTDAETIGQAAMPDELRELVAAFVAAHHVEEVFVKRQRKRHHVEEEHQFGQESLADLRARAPSVEDMKRKS